MRVEPTKAGHRLVGVIDESADFSAIRDGHVELDLSAVERINSMGILLWRRWASRAGVSATLVNVPVSFVNALSCVAGLGKGMRIRSVRAPVLDRRTGETDEVTVDGSTLAAIRATGTCPTFVSGRTAHELVLDDDPAQYFAFLRISDGPELDVGA